jgi:hypothetical protein
VATANSKEPFTASGGIFFVSFSIAFFLQVDSPLKTATPNA